MRDYAADLMGILALESVRGDFVVVGEDLGTVTGEVRHALGEAGVLGYRLLWFEKEWDGNFKPPDHYPAQALASATTHDLPTLAGFMLARDIEARKAAGLIDDGAYQSQKAREKDEIRKLERLARARGIRGRSFGIHSGDALSARDDQLRRSFGRDRTTESAGEHLAASELAS